VYSFQETATNTTVRAAVASPEHGDQVTGPPESSKVEVQAWRPKPYFIPVVWPQDHPQAIYSRCNCSD